MVRREGFAGLLPPFTECRLTCSARCACCVCCAGAREAAAMRNHIINLERQLVDMEVSHGLVVRA